MRMRRWFVAMASLVALVIGVGGGAVMAQTDETEGGSPIQGLISRVAGILGLEEQAVQDAFDQASEEMRDEAVDTKLAALVESGTITQEQADEYAEWYRSMPDSLGPKLRGHGFGFRGHKHGRRGGGFGKRGFYQGSPTSPTEEAPVPEGASL